MKILITAGTTPFDSLFQELDNDIFPPDFELLAQTGESNYRPEHFKSFKFDVDFQRHVDWADAVITHAGAGTVFKLLEEGKKCLVVANMERVDKHQQELARFVKYNHYGLATEKVDEVPGLTLSLPQFSPKKYEKTVFFQGDNLTEIILSYY